MALFARVFLFYRQVWRTFHTYSTDNLHLNPSIPRDSEVWQNVYKRRTSIERANKREKVDDKLKAGRYRSTQMWSMRLYGLMICQPIDAWYTHQQEQWDLLKETILTPQAA